MEKKHLWEINQVFKTGKQAVKGTGRGGAVATGCAMPGEKVGVHGIIGKGKIKNLGSARRLPRKSRVETWEIGLGPR